MKEEGNIRIRELSKLEINELENNKDNFSEFGPVKCHNCGFTGSFIRRLFEIKGMNSGSESDQNIVRICIKKIHNLEYCVFRSRKSINYIEGATCPKCKSQNVIFDISKKLCEEVFKKIKNGIFGR